MRYSHSIITDYLHRISHHFLNIVGQLEARITQDLKGGVKEAVRDSVKNKMSRLQELMGSLTARLEELDDRLIRAARIFGVEENTGEDNDGESLPGLTLHLQFISWNGRNARKRDPITFRLVIYQDRRTIYNNKKRLKGTSITVREDLSLQRLEVLKSVTAQHGLRNTWIQDGRVLGQSSEGRKEWRSVSQTFSRSQPAVVRLCSPRGDLIVPARVSTPPRTPYLPLSAAHSRVSIKGDLNSDLIVSATYELHSMTAMLQFCNLTLLPLQATHNIATIDTWLDVMAVSDPADVAHHVQLRVHGFSKHGQFLFVYKLRKPTFMPTMVNYQKYRDIDHVGVFTDDAALPWYEVPPIA
ncbi:hypothetical protein J6590_090800 [Homalodisca vitripennis]|nr:hypothetical protein J6590_090800 [Homalodisca vitripennis]